MKSMEIAIDFDGTVVTHEYPDVGKDVGAVDVIMDLVNNGHKIILNTMRSDEPLKDAEKWFEWNGIPLYGVNKNPTQETWTKSTKCYAQLYIDDAALGTPLVIPASGRPYVDWVRVRQLLIIQGLL